MTTAVLFVQNTSVSSIASFNDKISNEIPKILDPWSFELKIYRTNAIVGKLLAGMNQQNTTQAKELISRVMYTLNLSYTPKQTISIVNNEVTIFNSDRLKGDELLDHGCSTGFYDPIDSIIQNKLNALWQPLQGLKGEGGNSYEVTLDEEDVFIIRTANCFLHGGFKGFLVEMTYEKGGEDGEEKIKSLIKKLNFPNGKLSFDKLGDGKENKFFGDLAFQYTQALQI